MYAGDAILRSAVDHHQHGQLAEAESLYRQFLLLNDEPPPVLHLLGALLSQTNRYEEAISLLKRAVQKAPSVSMYACDLGNALRQAGQLTDAITAFESAVALDSASFAAVANLGNALGDAGRFEQAVAACLRAVELAPHSADAHSDLGIALRQADRFAEAVTSLQRAVTLDPQSAKCWCNLGSVLLANGQIDEAEIACRKGLSLDPYSALAMNNLAACRIEAGDAEQAIALLSEAIRIKPDYADALNNLGNALCGAGCASDAELSLRKALALRPEFTDARTNLATALRDQGKRAEALAESAAAVAMRPQSAAAQTNLGVCLTDEARFEQAIIAYEQAIELDPKSVSAHTNLAVALAAMGLRDRALAMARRAVEIDPHHAVAHVNLGLLLLTFGEFEQGWSEHEWRWKANPKSRQRDFPQPQWDGSSPHGQTILLHAEQGYGDCVQFMRYAPLVAQRGGKVILEVPPELVRLAQSLEGLSQVIGYGQPLPPFDLHCPLMSLPLAMATRLDNIPAKVPYVQPPADRVQYWAEQLGDDPRPRIGLVWAGRSTHSNDRNRSMPFDRLGPLIEHRDIQWISLQRGPAADATRENETGENETGTHLVLDGEKLAASPFHSSLGSGVWAREVLDLGNQTTDFADTAALLSNLHGLVSVDSAVAHVAGALGLPTWLMLPTVADWRWMTECADTPWYPRHRLVRQRQSGDWESVVEQTVASICGTPTLLLAASRRDGLWSKSDSHR